MIAPLRIDLQGVYVLNDTQTPAAAQRHFRPAASHDAVIMINIDLRSHKG